MPDIDNNENVFNAHFLQETQEFLATALLVAIVVAFGQVLGPTLLKRSIMLALFLLSVLHLSIALNAANRFIVF